MRLFSKDFSAGLGVSIMIILLFLQITLYSIDAVMTKQAVSISDKYDKEDERFVVFLNNISDNETTFWDQIGLGFLDDVAKAMMLAFDMLRYVLGEILNMMFLNIAIVTEIPVLGNVVQWLFVSLWIFAVLDFARS